MQSQLTRKRMVNILLVGTLAIGIGGFYHQPAVAQVSRSAFRETARELDLSRSQMQDVAGIMRSFNADLQDVLTSEQFERLQSTREQRQSQTQPQAQSQNPRSIQEDLNLTETQSAQLVVLREDMVAELQSVLDPDQLEGIMALTAFGQR